MVQRIGRALSRDLVIADARPSSTKEDTIRRLMQVAQAEFASKGLLSTRVDDIARAAGVTRQLVYHYFDCKNELFGSVLEEVSNRIMAELVAETFDQLPPVPALAALIRGFFEPYRQHPLLGALSKEIAYHGHCFTPRNRFRELAPALTQKVTDILARGEASGDFRPGVDPEQFMAVVNLMTIGVYTTGNLSSFLGYDPTEPQSMERWCEASVAFLLASVVVPSAAPAGGEAG